MKLVSSILSITSTVKALHWYTSVYGQHKALDELHKQLTERGDFLIESVIGMNSKLIESSLTLKLDVKLSKVTSDYVIDTLNNIHKQLLQLRNQFKDASLESIVDDMINYTRTAIYLCSME